MDLLAILITWQVINVHGQSQIGLLQNTTAGNRDVTMIPRLGNETGIKMFLWRVHFIL